MGLLADLVDGRLTGDPDTAVADATIDSRTVVEGSLFVAVPGSHWDGHAFISEAEANGAAGLCVSRDVTTELPTIAAWPTPGRCWPGSPPRFTATPPKRWP